jgi:hypothetical protein
MESKATAGGKILVALLALVPDPTMGAALMSLESFDACVGVSTLGALNTFPTTTGRRLTPRITTRLDMKKRHL